MLIFILLIPTSQELNNWFILVGFGVRVSKCDVDYGVSLDFPWYPNEEITLCLQYATPLTHLILWSYASLMDEGFVAYTVRGEVSLIKVEELVTNFIVTCNYEASIATSKFVM